MKTNRSSATKAVLLPVIAFILCFAICFSVTYTVAHAATDGSNVTFTDVPSTHWAYNDITEAASLGFINGYGDGRFGPSDPLTREQWIALVTRVIGATAETGDHMHTFSTANASAWAIPELVKAENMGLFSNGLNTILKPATYNTDLDHAYTFLNYKEPMPRFEAATIVAGALGWTNTSYSTPKPYDVGMQFPDIANPTSTASARWKVGSGAGLVGVCVNAGIINGYPDGNFGPENNLTRAEAAAMLMRMYRAIPTENYALKTSTTASVTWKTDKYGTHSIIHSPYATHDHEYTGYKRFSRNGAKHYVNLSHRFYFFKEEYDFVSGWLLYYTEDAYNVTSAYTWFFNNGILEWNDPNDHSKGAHGKYGIEYSNAVMNHDDEALKELITRIEHDHADNLTLYDMWVAAGKP